MRDTTGAKAQATGNSLFWLPIFAVLLFVGIYAFKNISQAHREAILSSIDAVTILFALLLCSIPVMATAYVGCFSGSTNRGDNE